MLRRTLLALLAGTAAVAATPSPAAAAEQPRTCTSPPPSSVVLETPDVLMTYAELRRERRGYDEIRTRACWRGQRRPITVATDFVENTVTGSVSTFGLLGGRWAFVWFDESGESEEGTSESTSRYLVDLQTGRQSSGGGADAVAGPAGLLATDDRGVRLSLPGRRSRWLAEDGAAAAPALGERTAYWTRRGGVADSAPVSPALAPAPAGRPEPRSPRGVRGRGPCEPVRTRTILRVAGGRVMRTLMGRVMTCASKTGRRLDLGRAVPGRATDAGKPENIRLLPGGLVAYELPLTTDETGHVVLDARTSRVRHVAICGPGCTGAVATPDGIALAADGIRWVTGREQEERLSPDRGTDLAVSAMAADGRVRVYWTAPEGPRSAQPAAAQG